MALYIVLVDIKTRYSSFFFKLIAGISPKKPGPDISCVTLHQRIILAGPSLEFRFDSSLF
jgi:hypothetical protein